MCPQHKSENGSEPGLPPGPDRFWGQFSEAKGGRSTSEDEPQTGPREEKAEEPAAGSGHECLEWCPICRSAELLKATAISPEVRAQIHSLQNEAMTILKAFATSYAEKSGEDPSAGRAGSNGHGSNGNGNGSRPEPDGPKVTDISIE